MIRKDSPPRLACRTKHEPERRARMIETYRMLGREHEADLAREAKRRQQASLVPVKVRRRRRPAPIHRSTPLRRWRPARPRVGAPFRPCGQR
jgi:hypothetical protein